MSLDIMKQALVALEGWANHGEWVWPESALEQAKRNTTESITALRAAIEQAQPELEQAMTDAIIGGTGVMLGDRRIDPASIYKQPEQEPVAWVYQEGLEALKSGRPWTAYGSNGGGRIPLYLNDAVAPRAEPRSGESGAGFESLPASPTQQEKNT